MAHQITDNSSKSRFELAVDGQIAFADYRRSGTTLVIPHVEAAPALRGTGAAGRLMHGVMAIARAEGRTVVPLCGYAASWMRAHKDYHDLLA